jgi:hypothetical protein
MTTPTSAAGQQIDAQLAALTDWRGDLVRSFRALVAEVEPELVEEWKWRTGMWSYRGALVCGYGVFAQHVKVNFLRGALLEDRTGAFNNGFDAQHSRSVDLRAGDALDRPVLVDLVHQAVDLARATAR